MAQTATKPRTESVNPLPSDVVRWRFTVEQYHRMLDIGILNENDRVELIDGEIIAMSAHRFPHARVITNLTRIFVMAAAGRWTVSVQLPLTLSDDSEPEPDFALLKGDGPSDRLPTPNDIFLVVEVSDSTLAFDLNVKLPRYARAEVPEYWVVDVTGERVERFSEPRRDGTYAKHARFGRDDEIASIALPDLSLNGTDVFN